MPQPTPNLYERLKNAGCEIDSHESDLYVKSTPESIAIIKQFESEGGLSNKQAFRSAIDGSLWIDLPFHYAPFWESRQIVRKPA